MENEDIANQKRMEYDGLMEKESFMYQKYLNLVIGGIIIFGLYLLSLKHFLLFHSIVESFSIVVAIGIFIIAWNSRRFLTNHYLLFIGVAYLFVATIDLIHMLAYKGMGVFSSQLSSSNLPTQLWIAARYLQAVSLLAAPLFLTRKIKLNLVFFDYAAAVALLFFSIFYLKVFPTAFNEGIGLTAFKKISEYLISLILAGSILFLYVKRRTLEPGVFRLIIWSIIFTIASELTFSDYINVYGPANAIGHLFRIVAVYLMYQAIVVTGFKKPYSIFFRDLKQSEEKLQAELIEHKKLSEESAYLASFPQLNPSPILEVNLSGKITFSNSATQKTLEGLKMDKRNPYVFLPNNIASIIKELKENDASFTYREITIKDKVFGENIFFTPQYDSARIYAFDITERKKSEQQLIETQNYLENLIDYANAPIIVWNPENKIVRFNNAFEYLTGYTANEVFEKDLALLFPAQTREQSIKEIESASAGKFWESVEIPILCKDGRIRIVLWNSANIYDKDGKTLMATIAQGQDITARKQMEKRIYAHTKDLEHEKAKDEAILSSIGHGVVATDEAEKVLFSNKGFEQICGFPEKELIGRKLSDVVLIQDEKGQTIPFEKNPLINTMASQKKTSDISTQNYYCVRKDKTRIPVAITASPIILDKKIIGAISVYRDITREREIDRAKTEFVSLASHQLRTPLASINLAAEMLLGGIAGEPTRDQRKYLRTIRSSIKEMAELIETLLNISRIESGALSINPEPTSLPHFIDDLLRDFSIQIEDKKINLKRDYDKVIPPLNIDRKLMQLIFDNLISNAIKYTKIKDTIAVAIKRNNHAVIVSVSDTGCGIPNHQHSQVFTKLFRADNLLKAETKGSGLGLYIVKACVDQYGGKVWFESEENIGTTFYVTLPLKGMRKRENLQRSIF